MKRGTLAMHALLQIFLSSSMALPFRAIVAGLWVILVAGTAGAADLLYSFHDGHSGGLARLRVDAATGETIEHQVLYQDAACTKPNKIVTSQGGTRALLTNLNDGADNLIVIDWSDDSVRSTILTFPSEPDEVRAFGEMAIVGGDGGHLVVVDLAEPRIVARFNARKQLEPSGHKVEDIHVLPCGTRALLSFQKDSSSGRHRGSRLVVVTLPALEVMHDMQLPRNRPEFHYPMEINRREQGPNPEVIVISEATNTLALSLDLYGAVALADLDAVVEQGQWRDLTYVSTAVDGSWGHSFPDRVAKIAIDADEHLVLFNAGPDGGAVLVNLNQRRVVQRIDTFHGLETPVYLTAANAVVASPAGKLKRRGADGLEKSFHPREELHLFRVRVSASGFSLTSEVTKLPWNVFRLSALDPQHSALLMLIVGSSKPELLVVYDAIGHRTISQTKAFGVVARSFVINNER